MEAAVAVQHLGLQVCLEQPVFGVGAFGGESVCSRCAQCHGLSAVGVVAGWFMRGAGKHPCGDFRVQ